MLKGQHIRYCYARLGLVGIWCLVTITARAQDVSPHPTWYHTVLIGYEGVHQTGPYVHVNTVYKGRLGLEAGYGSDFLNTFTITGKYFLNKGLNQFYTGVGYGHFRQEQEPRYLYMINTAHAVLGYQSVIGRHWVIGAEVSFVKYLDQRFRLPRLQYSETYDWDESNYFAVGVSIGYRFNFSGGLQKRN